MEFQKIINLLDIASDDKHLSRYVTKKWIEVCDQSEKKYNVNKEIRIKTPMLRSDLCDFSMRILLRKEILLLKVMMMMLMNIIKILYLKIMHHLLIASQKFMA